MAAAAPVDHARCFTPRARLRPVSLRLVSIKHCRRWRPALLPARERGVLGIMTIHESGASQEHRRAGQRGCGFTSCGPTSGTTWRTPSRAATYFAGTHLEGPHSAGYSSLRRKNRTAVREHAAGRICQAPSRR